MSWWKKVVYFFTPLSSEELPNPLKEKVKVKTKVVRARSKKGRYVADDLSTPDVNEAYTTVKVTKKKRGRPRKKK
tara:strand:+ start:1473 stop:1697 length:225 start_codon:yes stop_codon:yes gene_type:complete